MMKQRQMTIFGLFVCFLVISNQALAGEEHQPAQPAIQVYGSVEIEHEPDYVKWRVTFTDHDINALKAKERNDERYEALLEIGEDLDISRADMISGHVSIIKRTRRDREQDTYEFRDYEVKRTLVFLQRDMEELDKMLEQLATASVEFRMSYESSQLEQLKREARTKAVALARTKAQELAGELGQFVGRPLRIRELDVDESFDLDDAISNSSIRRVDGRGVGVRHGAISVRCAVEVDFLLVDP